MKITSVWKSGKLVIDMLTITFQVNVTPDQTISVKEQLAMFLEQFGDTKVISVQETVPEQLKF